MKNLTIEFIKKVANVEMECREITGDCRGVRVRFDNDSSAVYVESKTACLGGGEVRLSMYRDGRFKVYAAAHDPSSIPVMEKLNRKYVMKEPSALSGEKHIGIREGIKLLSTIIPGADDESSQEYAFSEMFTWWFNTLGLDVLPSGAMFIHVYN